METIVTLQALVSKTVEDFCQGRNVQYPNQEDTPQSNLLNPWQLKSPYVRHRKRQHHQIRSNSRDSISIKELDLVGATVILVRTHRVDGVETLPNCSGR